MRKVGVSILMAMVLVSFATSTVSAQENLTIYGYLSLYFENVGPLSNDPSDEKGDPGEFDYANLNVMLQSNVSDNVRAFVNLAGTSGLEVKNYWGEYVVSDKIKIRAGKIYRPFGQFNELLDAVPTYLGMEPPELFDKDHLMLPRVGKIMLHGGTDVGENYLTYAYMLDSDENMLASNNEELSLSHSWNLKFSMMNDNLVFGHSGFLANEVNGSATGVGEGSPRTGVQPWMSSDKYNVMGAYATFKSNGITLKGAYWTSNHDAVRDADGVATIFNNTSLLDRQIENFYGSGYAGDGSSTDVVTAASYTVSTYYLRVGYTFSFKGVELTPYAFIDSYTNPETIASKTWGGDAEAGVSDDGSFTKPTYGIAIRPTYNVALKIDGSSHIQEIGGESVKYNEVRMDLSYLF